MSQPTAASGGKAVQVMVGSGGSPFEALQNDATINPATDRDYAWCTVSIYKDGVVKLVGYGFDDHFGATKTLLKVTLK